MAQMTAKELTDHIKNTVGEYLKADGLAGVLEVIEEKIRKSVDPLVAAAQTPAWVEKMFDAKKAESVKSGRKPGDAIGHVVRALHASRQQGSGTDGALKYLRDSGGGDIAEACQDAQQKALAASNAPAGGFLVAPQYSTDILDLRRSATVVRGSGPRMVPMPTGTLHLPKVATGSTGSYIGENVNITKSEPSFGETVLTWKKLAVVVPISNDLIRYSAPAADAIVRDDIVRSLAVTEDAKFLRGDGTGGDPKGLRYWVASDNVIAAQSASLANVAADLGRLVLTLQNDNIPSGNWGFLLAPRTAFYLMTVQTSTGAFAFRDEVSQGRIYGFPFKQTTAIPINQTVGANADCSEIFLVNFDDMVIGDSQRLTLDVSTEAAYHDGSSVVAAFSKDQAVVRAIAEHDFAARDENAIAIANGVRWGV